MGFMVMKRSVNAILNFNIFVCGTRILFTNVKYRCSDKEYNDRDGADGMKITIKYTESLNLSFYRLPGSIMLGRNIFIKSTISTPLSDDSQIKIYSE